MKIASATTEFLDDLGKANLVAKKELGELASTRIGKAIAVGAAGAGLEWISGQVLGKAMDTLLLLLPSKNEEDMKKVKGFFNNGFIRESIEDAGVYKFYKEANKLIGDELPDVPVSYLGAAIGVNAADWAIRNSVGQENQLKNLVGIKEKGRGKNKEFSYNMVANKSYKEPANDSKTDLLNFIPRTAGVLADVSNPVILYGTAQVVEGVSAYARAVRDVLRARKVGGESMVQALLTDAKKEKLVGKKRDKQERILDMLEATKENGK